MMDRANFPQTGVALLASRLCVLGEDPCGGSEVVLWEDARILQNAGFPVRVYARAASNGAAAQTITFRTRTARLNTMEYARALLRKEREGPIIAYNEPALAGFAPGRVIVRFDWATPLPRYWNWPAWLSRFRRARYLFPSESERNCFLQQYSRIPAGQTIVLPNAVDLELFKPAKEAPPAPNRRVRVGFAGQWTARKGIEQLLEAWQVVHSALPTCDLCLAGGPDLWRNVSAVAGSEQLATRLRELERQGILHCAGALRRADMPSYWNSLDVAVVPSLYEPFGLVALEALACGIPVVASAAGGLKEIVVDGECGLLVPPGDALALAHAFRLLLTDDSLRKRLGAGARARARQFSLERRSRELVGLLLRRADQAA